MLEGDANTGFFHGVANGKKRKCTIKSLEEGENMITEMEQLKKHVTDFYKKLFGGEETPGIHLSEDFWEADDKLTEEDRRELTKPFTMVELGSAVKEMRSNTAPAPDGFFVLFLRNFGGKLKKKYLKW